jgi:hypothetical protein
MNFMKNLEQLGVVTASNAAIDAESSTPAVIAVTGDGLQIRERNVDGVSQQSSTIILVPTKTRRQSALVVSVDVLHCGMH